MKLELPHDVRKILNILNINNYSAYVVGGAVRDLIRGKTPKDYDIATSATPDEIESVFAGYTIIDVGREYGTLVVRINNVNYEITTFRKDSGYDDGRRPSSVEFADTINEDLCRRDFTINAIAYNPKLGLIDPYGGCQDIVNGLVKCVGNPDERFREDGLRILRAVRLSIVLNYNIDYATKKSIVENKGLLSNISGERIQEELNKSLLGINKRTDNFKIEFLLSLLFKEFEEETPQNNPYHKYGVRRHTIESIKHSSRLLNLRLALLFHDIGKINNKSTDSDGIDHFHGHNIESSVICGDYLNRFRYPKRLIAVVVRLVFIHDMELVESERFVRKLISREGYEVVRLLLLVKYSDMSGRVLTIVNGVVNSAVPLSKKDLCVDGNDMLELGLSGRDVGVALDLCLDAVLNNPECNCREVLLGLVENREQ